MTRVTVRRRKSSLPPNAPQQFWLSANVFGHVKAVYGQISQIILAPKELPRGLRADSALWAVLQRPSTSNGRFIRISISSLPG